MKTFCASYFYKRVTFFKNQFGFGNCFFNTPSSCPSTKTIRELENNLKKNNKFTGCCVINCFEVKVDEKQ